MDKGAMLNIVLLALQQRFYKSDFKGLNVNTRRCVILTARVVFEIVFEFWIIVVHFNHKRLVSVKGHPHVSR